MIKTVLKDFGLRKDSKWGDRLRPPNNVGQDERGSMVIKRVVKQDAVKKVYHAAVHKYVGRGQDDQDSSQGVRAQEGLQVGRMVEAIRHWSH